ncbi:5-(carboxyamino)imidazole ribonucleotide mutase [Staphylococcus epidermidis]|uniref:5-(carboxyamino)imidazole ribonucleotide mutase n=1 Tax=Staphylococcus epidermidis TaxID=1282 RepID=UPI00124F0C7B|nr:5-(carboxyamino)imidazole ribonucleotide mutase [Staphylococcus epidermidis]KAB2282817.1 5-(carboxyamino)imidazole ribonucleotide mutase [Staphylococcus epidermidis]MCG2351470.1 5-(carboxyamino)imidazole ribonucleotide mutase [Staphylococcus epidermidis]MDS3950580.1 5-(carboxyamino)imidazole ribonucleotide mutase [Staphylococcus epidermidis]MEB6267724.1 5-(carboxyamino)imidazole ribonucleotide mutase [Staphylococcus epidermidis]
MKVAVIMGSSSDWKIMKESCSMLEEFEIPYEKKVVSAHRTPQMMFNFASQARQNGFDIIIAGAGGAAHLPGMVASMTTLPVIGVPIESKSLKGLDSLLSIVQMPGGIPVATTAIGKAGAKNAGILAARMLGITNESVQNNLENYEKSLVAKVEEMQNELQ